MTMINTSNLVTAAAVCVEGDNQADTVLSDQSPEVGHSGGQGQLGQDVLACFHQTLQNMWEHLFTIDVFGNNFFAGNFPVQHGNFTITILTFLLKSAANKFIFLYYKNSDSLQQTVNCLCLATILYITRRKPAAQMWRTAGFTQ